MLLKLVLPYQNRMFQGGYIVRWFKEEGDRIDYGDDLFEFRVEKVRVTRTVTASDPGRWLEQMAKHLNAPPAVGEEGAEFDNWNAVVVLRVASSDLGYLRRISAREGDYCEVGGVVGLATTEESEPFAGQGEAPPLFRVVTNMTPEM